MDKFDPYEYIGVIVPGTVIVLAVLLLHPELGALTKTSVSLGDLGLIVILAFVAGHLLQAVSNPLEKIYWFFWGGMPTDRIVKNKAKLLAPTQFERLKTAIAADFKTDIGAITAGYGLTREVYAYVGKSGKTDRIDAFNRTYGLLRGISVAFVITIILVCFKKFDLNVVIGLALALIAGVYRMTKFANYYARELFVQYLVCRPTT